MTRRQPVFTQADVSRAIRAADKAGAHRWAVEILADGTIRLIPTDPQATKAAIKEKREIVF